MLHLCTQTHKQWGFFCLAYLLLVIIHEAGHVLAAVDAVQHVKDCTPYPATMLTTGNNDPMVAPWQPGKMAARLQAGSTSGRPIVLRVDFDAGNGAGSEREQQDDLFADQLAFFLSRVDPGLGSRPFREPKKSWQ